jgi:microcystin-dependent protein
MNRSRDAAGQRTSDKTTGQRAPDANKPKHKRRRTIGFMPLEPRVMYDGAAVATAATTHHHHHSDGAPIDPSTGGPIAGGAAAGAMPGQGAGHDDGHWHHDATPSAPMPTVTTWVKDPSEIVFIDQQAPDYQLLASGVKPGIEVVVLDPNSDGIQQIANFLSGHPDPNLTTIDIVAHGQDGMLFLGNAVLDNDTVGQYAAQLKTIGASLQPGGDLMLYGCDVAANPDGVNLLAQIIDETGVNVAASTGPVGSAAEGGSWALNAQSGVIDAKSPFTAATMAAYPDVLNADLFVTTLGSSDAVLVDQNGGVTTATAGSGVVPEQIVLDTADNLYFVVSTNTTETQILEGRISNALAGNGSLFTLYSDTAQNPFNTQAGADAISGIQVDTTNHLIYFVDNVNGRVGTNETSVFEKFSYSAAGVAGNNQVAPTVLGTVFNQNAAGNGGVNGGVVSFAMDFTNSTSAEAVFAVNVGGEIAGNTVLPATAELFVAQNLAPAAATATITAFPLNIPVADGFFTESGGSGGLAIADNNGNPVLYFTLFEGSVNTRPNSTTGQGLYSYSLSSSNTTGAFTAIYQQTTGNPIQLDAITIDTVTHTYYGVDSANGDAGIYVGSLTVPGTPTLLTDFSAKLPASGNPGATDVVVDDVAVSTGSNQTAVTYTEGNTPVVVNNAAVGNSITVADDGTPITSATVSVTNFQSGDTLGILAGDLNGSQIVGTNITESYDSTTGKLTLTGKDTAAHYQTALNEVTFSTTAASVTARTISFSATDGLVSGSGSDTIDILGQPVIGGTSGASAKFYQSSGSPQVLDNAITVSDPNGVEISSASVTLSGTFSANDLLADNGVTNGGTVLGNIKATYNSATHQLTLTGLDTAADYQTALREISYSFTGDPTNAGANQARTVSWFVSDADGTNSADVTTALNVYATPAVVVGANSPMPTTSGTAVMADPGLTITDSNTGAFTNANSFATVQITGGFQTGDELTIGDLTSGTVPTTTISFSYNTANHTLTLSGADTLADYQKALDEVQFNATSPNSGTRTLTWQVNDEAGANANDSVAVTSTVAAAFPPAVTAGATVTFTGGGNAVTLDSGLVIADGSNPTLASATVTDAGFITGDILNFTNTNTTTEGNIAGSYANGVLTLTSAGNTATLAQWQTALESVTYSFSPGNGDPTNGGGTTSRTIDWQITDTTPQSSALATSTLNTVHVAPSVTAGNSTIFATGGTAVPVDLNVTVDDPDSGNNLSGATITISSGLASGDVLSFTPVGNITGAYSNGVLTLTGNGTIAQYQAVLESVTYVSTAGDPTSGGADTSRSISWTVTDGSSSHGTSAAASSTIAIDTTPGVVAGGFVDYTGGGSGVVLDSSVTITDSLGSLSRATVAIEGSIAGDTLMINGATSGTIAGSGISYFLSGSTLVLSGTATTAQYEAALDSVTYTAGNSDPTGGGTRTSRTIDWQVTDTASLTSNVASSILNTTHVAPTVTTGANASQVFDGGSAASGALDNTLVITDNNSGGNLVGAMVQIVNPVQGEVLNFTALDGVTSTYSNGVLTISGTASVGDYQTMLRSVTVGFNPQNLDPTAGGTVGKQLIYWAVNDGNSVNGTNETFPPVNPVNNDQPSLGLNQIVVESGVFPTRPDDGDGDVAGIPLGSIRTFAGDDVNVFSGAAPADGQTPGIGANTALFSILGTNFGGNGTSTFGLPNLQGTIIVGSDGPVGESFGSNQFTLTHPNLPPLLGGSGTPFDNDQPSLQVNYIINVGGQFSGNSTDVMGEVVPFLGNFAPAGYAFANGQLLSIAANPVLFDILGTTYGGDGTNTFALPDLNGKTIIGAGFDPHTGQNVQIGTTTGQDLPTLTNQNLPFPNGPDQPVSNDQPSLALTYLVATQGIFPNGAFQANQPDLGEVIAYAGTGSQLSNMLQDGWAVANGQTLSIQQNAALFTLLGTTYGGDGQTTFALPDLVGRAVAGVGTNQGTTTSLGEQFGTDSFTLTSGNFSTQNIPVPNVATSVLDLVHEPPVVTAGATTTFHGGDAPVPIDPTLGVSAPDSSDMLTGATVQITGGFKAGDTLNFTGQNGISEVSFSNGELTLSGNATAEQYQAALESITYSFNPANGDPTIGNTDTTRTISYVVNDGLENSTAVTSTLNVVHTPPSVTAGASTTFAFGGSPVTLDNALTVSDPDSSDLLTGATVKIDNGFLPGDSLNFTTQNAITGSYNSSNGVLTLTGSATVEQYQAALDSITFSTTNQTGASHTIDWTVSDSLTTSAVATSTVAVEVGPQITAGATVNGTEGASTGMVTVATFTDSLIAATASDFTATINWGDGLQTSGTVIAQNGGGFAVTGAHTYAEEGSYTIGVAVADTNNITGSANDSATIADAVLTALGTDVSEGVEGVTPAILNATFRDANPGAAASDFSGTVAWGDGTSSNFSSSNVTAIGNGTFTVSGLSHVYAEEGTDNINVVINDAGGSTTTAIGAATVTDAPLTAAGATLSGTEGAALAATVATFTDANPNAPLSDFTATINWGDGTNSSGTVTENAGVFSVAGTHTYGEEGSYAPTVTINDVGGSTTQATGTATIADAALTAGTATVSGGVEGVTAATLSATFTDANTGATASDFSGTIAWGDGTTTTFTEAAVAGSNGNFTVSGSHLYAEEGTYRPTVTINDVGGSTTTDSGTTTAADAPLTAAGTTLSGTEGAALAATVATFADANPNAPLSDFTATINWGDGSNSSGTVTENAGVFSVAGTHAYAKDGHYTSVVTINDVGGSTAQATSTIDVVPTAPAIKILVGQPVDNGTVELKGTGEVGETINLYADGNTTTIIGTGTVGAGGTFDITTTADFPDGVHTFTAKQTDAANLTSTASTPAFSVDVAPTLSVSGLVTYVQNGSPIQLDATATADLGEPGGPLTRATVSIGSGFIAGDVLNFTSQNGITGSYDAVHGVLTLTGSASVANYNAALDSISFSSTSPNPSNDGANLTRTISWSVTDANTTNAVSATETSTVEVHAVPTVLTGPTVSSGYQIDYNAGPGMSVVLDPTVRAYDSTNLTSATVAIANGIQPGDTLSANTAGTNIHASYANGILTLAGIGTPQEYQAVLASITFSSAQSQSGVVSFTWQVTDHNNVTSAVATSTVEITGNLVPPPVNTVANPLPASTTGTPVADFSGLLTNAVATAGEVQTVGQAFNPTVHVIHSDVTASIGPDGAVAFNLPLIPLEAALGGDVASVTATLANGQPLPTWLQFNQDTGQFAGLVPDDNNVETGSIEPDGGIRGQPHDPNMASIVPQLITIEVLARDSKGNVAITEFTIDLSAPTPHKGDKHGWNVLPNNGAIDSASGPHRDIALWHGAPAFDADRVQPDHASDRAPIGRAGFSDQIKNHGWHAAAAQRMALLDSLQQAGRR